MICIWKRWKWCLPFQHFGLYCGDDSVINHPGIMDEDCDGKIRRTTLAELAGPTEVRVCEFPAEECLPPDEVVQRAEPRFGEDSYHLLCENCEHFAR